MQLKIKAKIYFFIPSLRAGGAERIVSYLAQNIDKEKFTSTLIVIGYEADRKFDVEGIEVIYLNQPRVLYSFFKVFQILFRRKP